MTAQETLDLVHQELAKRADHICFGYCDDKNVDHDEIQRNIESGKWMCFGLDLLTTYIYYMPHPDAELKRLFNLNEIWLEEVKREEN